jgi:hypothetical protein
MKRLWLLLPLLALAGCNDGVSTTLQLSNYETTCSTEADCIAAFVGDPCETTCQCPNAALNQADFPREQSDLMAVTALCATPPATCTMACPSPAPTCTKGVCGLP